MESIVAVGYRVSPPDLKFIMTIIESNLKELKM